MGYDEIMKSIKSGLTGDDKEDIKYLQSKMEEYKTHELGQEIIKACARLLFELLPEDAKEQMNKAISVDMLNVESTLDEVRYAMFKKDFKRALEIIEPLAKSADELPLYKEDAVSVSFNFKELFEELLYTQINKIEKTVRRSDYPYDVIYFSYGCLLVELERIEEANVTLKKALQWNPVNIDVRSEYMETLKILKRLDEYLEMAIESFKYAYKEKDVARCLRNLGWYMVETGKYKEAMGVYFVSLEYDKESKAAQSELYFIHATNPDVNEPTLDELKEISEQYGFPLGPSMEVVKTAFLYGRFFEEKKNYGIAKYCYGIAYDLTHDKSLKDMIEALPANEE